MDVGKEKGERIFLKIEQKMVEIKNFLSYDLKKCLLFVSIGLKLK